MKALVVAPQPFFTPRGTPFSVYFRALVMAEQGVEIDLLTYGEGEDVDIPGVRLIRIPHPNPLRPVPVGPSWRKVVLDSVMMPRMLGLLARNRYDFVHAHEEAVAFCLGSRPLFRLPFVYDMHSSLPQQLTNFGFTRSRLLIGAFKSIETAALRRATAVITISPRLAELALSCMPEPSRHFLIENSIFGDVRLARGNGEHGSAMGGRAAEGDAGAAEGGAPRGVGRSTVISNGDSELELPTDRRLVFYAGTFEKYQGLDLLLDAFPSVVERVPDAFLCMVGGLPDQVKAYRERASALGLEGRSLIHGRVPQSVVRSCQTGAAVLVSPRSHGTNTPLKVYEQLATGLPLVATRIESHTQVLDDQVCFLVEPRPEELARGIVQALTDRERTERRVEAARTLYSERYSRPMYERKIRQLLDLIERHGD